jgi:quercetin dioxygenase-like cupin family protein
MMTAHRTIAACAGLLLLAPGAMPHTAAADASRTPPAPAHISPGVRTLLSTTNTVTGAPIKYPPGTAKLTAVEITLKPGQETGWHKHPVPLFGYVLEGELTVDYGAKGKRVYRKGDALAEAINEVHNGRNTGKRLMRILCLFIGADGEPGTVSSAAPEAKAQ